MFCLPMCHRDLATSAFEIVLTMEGTTPETGNTIQVQRTAVLQVPLNIVIVCACFFVRT